MRIVQVVTRGDVVGGAQLHVLDLSTSLIAAGHDVTVLLGGQGSFTDRLAAADVPFRTVDGLVRPIRPWHDIPATFRLRTAILAVAPDVVAAHSSKAGTLARLACRCLAPACVFTAHGWAFADGVTWAKRWVYRKVERRLSPLADRIITVSEADRRLALDADVGSNARLVTVANGLPDVAPPNRPAPAHPRCRLVMVARFAEQKDHRLLLDALATLEGRAWHLDLVGDGPDEAAIRRHAKKLGLGDQITFHGYLADVQPILARADLFVLVSRWEGLPLTVIEAMRARLPVVASDVGGVREAVVDNETGLLVPPGERDRLASALACLIDADAKRRQLGLAGRRRFDDAFQLERMVCQTLGVYREALADRSPARPFGRRGN
jgi:glycosyltransferase involved in cell wall biosynthesis